MLTKPQLSSVLINLICAKLLLSYPRRIIQNSASAAWIEMIYVTLIVLALFCVTARVYKSKKSIIELGQILFGKYARIIVGIICFLILGTSFVSVLRIYSESVKIILLQNTDVDLILAIFILTSAIGAYIGLKPIAKISYIVLPVAALIFVGFLLLLVTDYNSQNIAPLFGTGPKNLLIDGINSCYVFSDIIVLNLLLSHTDSIDNAFRTGVRSIVISGIVGTLICFAYCLIFPYPTSKEFIMPVYQLTRFINTSSFFNRFEAFFQFTWSILVMLYGSAYIYLMSYTWQISFSLKHLRPLIFPVSLLCASVALLPDSLMDFIEVSHSIEIYIYPTALLLPLVIGFIARKKLKKDI